MSKVQGILLKCGLQRNNMKHVDVEDLQQLVTLSTENLKV